MWIDTHCHLNDPDFEADCPAVVAGALQAGVGRLIVAGYDLDSSRRALELARLYDPVYAAVGIHPHDAKIWNDTIAAELREMLTGEKVVGLGEIGLDYHYNYSSKEEQLRAFREQLQIAKAVDKPVIIHNREAHHDTLQVLTEVKPGPAGGVLHCFTGSRETALSCLALGLYISFAGPLTFTNANKLRQVAAGLPLEKILVETDSPYLSPHPLRGERNEPARVGLVGAKLAELHGITVEEVQKITTDNARGLFRIV
jgi:TatD DNase family protein